MNLDRQPAFWIGLIVTIIAGIVSTLLGEGVINDALAGRITSVVQSLSELAVILAPLIAGLIIRTQVTPVAAPSLPKGTVVEVTTPGDEPNTRLAL